ncbi:hypothetical protein [Collimonas sp. OK242]|uniref:hypothetical protein n=1 Tax=Collimonas sp. OK242 TaxID=1798195 RepID=UPI0015A2ABA6|nr:hypothetical protein [Collimonas sp. OK242]
MRSRRSAATRGRWSVGLAAAGMVVVRAVGTPAIIPDSPARQLKPDQAAPAATAHCPATSAPAAAAPRLGDDILDDGLRPFAGKHIQRAFQ